MNDGIFDNPEGIEEQTIDSTDEQSYRRMTRRMDRTCPHCQLAFHPLALRKHIVILNENSISIQTVC